MSTQTLSSVAIEVVGQYGQAGKLVVGATRKRARRFFDDTNTRYAEFLDRRPLPLVNDAVKASLVDAQQRIAGFHADGITAGSDGAWQAIDTLAAGLQRGVERMAAAAERVEAALDSKALSTVGTLTLPVAQLSLEIANRTLQGAESLSERWVGGDDPVVEVAAPVTPPAKKGARRARARA